MKEKERSNINKNHIILWFLNFDFPHEEITIKLNLQPTRIATKGQEQVAPNGVKKISRHTYWEYEWKYESNEFISDVAKKFVDEIIKPRTEQIKTLAEKVDAEFKIVQYYYDGFTPGYHFTPQTLQALVEANLEMDIDVYCLYQEEANR